MNNLIDELEYEKYIIDQLTAQGYTLRHTTDYDTNRGMDAGMLFRFLEATQANTLKKILTNYKGDEQAMRESLVNALNMELLKPTVGLLSLLNSGFYFCNQKLTLLYRKPATSFNPKQSEQYGHNTLSVIPELVISPKERIDLVIFLNGLPIVSIELKCNQSNQNYTHAIEQYRTQRDHKNRLFVFKAGCLVNFAMDLSEVYMTTHLNGKATHFIPFNMGKGEGINIGKGNPVFDDRYSVSYMWDDILTKDTLIDLISNYIFLEHTEEKDPYTGKTKKEENIIFPRYHQLRTLRNAMADLKENHTSQNYLIQHSPGSGKTKTIAWLAHHLTSLHDDNDEQIFDKVVIMTDRVVVDRQLQDAIQQIEHKAGLIKVMNENCTSADLAKALNGKVKIVATTIQKFLYIVDAVSELKEKKFAVIIDEAHSSTSGKDMMAVTQVLSSGDDDERDVQDIMLDEIQRSGKQENVSMFAFTATPKPTTLAQFGRRGVDGMSYPFDLYSMKQAIEEEFIMDVLDNYTEYATYYKVNKTIEDDPSYKNRKAKKHIKHLADVDDEHIEKRVAVVAEHFCNTMRHQMNGEAKAMVVMASREAAVKFKLEFDRYLKEHGKSGVKALVAFSGKVVIDCVEYTEVGMNGFAENKLPDHFATPEYNVLIVANKYQTGFDQKRLAAMYVFKKLKDISAVQTLSRLNRIYPKANKKTFVLDFANSYDDIKKSFSPYYTATILNNTVTPQDVYKLDAKIERFGILDLDDVEEFVKLCYKRGITDKEKIQLEGYVQKAYDEVLSRPIEEQKDIEAELKRFVRLYEFVLQCTAFEDVELHKRYKFIDALQDWIKRNEEGQGINLIGKVEITNFMHKFIEEHHQEKPDIDPYISLPQAETTLTEDEEKLLSEIIREINGIYGQDFDVNAQAKAMLQIKELLLNNQKLMQSALVNKIDDFQYTYYDEIDDTLVDGLEQSQSFFELLLNNDDLKNRVLGVFLNDVYSSLKSNNNQRTL